MESSPSPLQFRGCLWKRSRQRHGSESYQGKSEPRYTFLSVFTGKERFQEARLSLVLNVLTCFLTGLSCGCMWAEARGQILLAWIYWTCCFTTAGLSRARLVLSVFSLQNRLASTRAELGGKTCSVAGPTQKPRAALGEIGNVAVINKDVTKKVKSFFFFFKNPI